MSRYVPITYIDVGSMHSNEIQVSGTCRLSET